jgi:pimeloyl-ACP methyl ester carboxylesterase
MDGAPPWARYAANDLLIAGRIATLRTQMATAREMLGAGDLAWFVERIVEAHLSAITGEIAELESWLAEDRQILLFDSAGDGRVVEVFGDLESAVNIGVVVPGITNDRGNFSGGGGGFRAGAQNIHERAGQLSLDDVATIAWLGYDTPDGADAVLRGAAEVGRDALVDFVAGLDALPGRRHTAVVGHSYGSLVTGLAAGAGLAADEVVFVGSPGTGLAHADDAKLKAGGLVWAGLADGDPIGVGLDVSKYLTPVGQIEQAVRRLLDFIKGEDAIRGLHHGTNPTHYDFGAIEIRTEGSDGHSEYFKPNTVTLDNLLYIITGKDARVSTKTPGASETARGPFGKPPVAVTA